MRRFNAADLYGANINNSVETNGSTNEKIDKIAPKAYPIDELGKPTDKWDYKAEDGNLIACVYRYDTPEGKEFRPWDVKARRNKSLKVRPFV